MKVMLNQISIISLDRGRIFLFYISSKLEIDKWASMTTTTAEIGKN